MAESARHTFTGIVRLLRSEVSPYAVYGVAIALTCVVIATLIGSWLQTGTVSVDGIVALHTGQPVMWVLNAMPFVYALWGQYASMSIAYRTGAIVVDQTDRLRTEMAALEHRALHDALTDLPNRVLIHDRLENTIQMARRQHYRVGVLVVDMNNFKEINDVHGHAVGDLVLQTVARLLGESLRKSDTIGRLGGDEFLVMHPNAPDIDSARLLAERLSDLLATPVVVDRREFRVSASIGIAIFPDHANDADQLVEKADTAMYHAKQSGMNYAVYEAGLEGRLGRDLTRYAMQLQEAVINDGFTHRYQPRFALDTERVVGAEAHVYWDHPEAGAMHANDLLPTVEQLNLGTGFVLAMIRRAIADIQHYGDGLTVALDLPIYALYNELLAHELQALVAQAGIAPRRVTLLVSERGLAHNNARGYRQVQELAATGMQVGLRDFGTGPSGLIQLAELPMREIRISDNIMATAARGEEAAHFVRGAIQFAKAQGWRCVAGGVDTAAIYRFARDAGIDQIVGLHIGPETAISDLVKPPDQSCISS